MENKENGNREKWFSSNAFELEMKGKESKD